MSADEFICPVCGATVSAKAKVCPECGSDEKTGWSDRTIYDGAGIEDPDEFDYDDFVRREFGGKGKRRSKVQWLWWTTAVVILAACLWLFLIRHWCAIP